MKRTLCTLAILASALPAPTAIAATSALPKIETITLSNGLPVMLIERHELPIISARLTLKAGQVFEPSDKAGLAVLTASLLEKGTQKYSAEAIAEQSEFLGGSIGASASRDSASIGFDFLKKDYGTALSLFGEMLKAPTFPESELEKAKSQTLAGLKSSLDEPQGLLELASARAFYGNHPYGRSIGGTLSSVPTLSRKDILGFYNKYYRPQNAFMAVVGDISPSELKSSLEQTLAGWQASSDKPEGPNPLVPPQGQKVVLVDSDINQAYISLVHQGIKRNDPAYQKTAFSSYILGGGSVARLYREIRSRQGLAYSVYSGVRAATYAGTTRISIQTKTGSATQAVKGILEQVRLLRTHPVTPLELVASKQALVGDYSRSLETNSTLLDYLTLIGQYQLGTDYLARYTGQINAFKAADVKDGMHYFDPEHYVLTVVGKAADLKAPLSQFGTVEVVEKEDLIK